MIINTTHGEIDTDKLSDLDAIVMEKNEIFIQELQKAGVSYLICMTQKNDPRISTRSFFDGNPDKGDFGRILRMIDIYIRDISHNQFGIVQVNPPAPKATEV